MKKNKIMIYIKDLEDNDFNATLLNFLKNTKKEIDLYVEYKTTKKIKIPKKINIINLNIPSNHLKKFVIIFKKLLLIIKSYKKYSNGLLLVNSPLGNFLIRNMCKNKSIYILNNILLSLDAQDIRNYFSQNKIYEFNNIIFLNNQDKELFLKYYPSLIKKTHVINYLLDIKFIEEKSKERIKETIKRTDINLLLITELNEEKNKILSQIKMVEKIKNEIPSIKLYIIGEGIDKIAYASYIEDHKLESTIFLLGKKTNIYPYIKKSHYYLTNEKQLSKLLLELIYLKTEIISKYNLSDDCFVLNENFGHSLLKGKKYDEQILYILKNKKKNTKKVDFAELNNQKINNLENILND